MNKNIPDTSLHIDDSNIDSIVYKYPVIVVDCWAPLCGPCTMVGPVTESKLQGK